MIKIPLNAKYSVPSKSDLFGNIWYTKNVNFDEEGYIKLSSRSVSIANEEVQTNLEIPLAFGRESTGFFVVSADSAYDIALSNSTFSVTEDTATNNPTLTTDSHGKWWQNRWHATTDTAMFYKTAVAGNWTDTGVTLTSGKKHPIEVFRNRVTVCVGNGNVVKQYTTGYGGSIDLTLPTDYEITGLAYSASRMGIITRLDDSVANQNQEAYFFVWDGAGVSPNSSYPIGSNAIVGIAAYKSSWILLNNVGQILYFNGGGFDQIIDLSFYYKNVTWTNLGNTFTDIVLVEGDLIYFNLNGIFNPFGTKAETYLESNPGGILCYDPNVGLYHRYSPSNSRASYLTVTDVNVNITTNIMTKTGGTLPVTGNPVKYVNSKSTQIGGLTVGVVYYIIRHTTTTFSLASTYLDAIAGNKIDLTTIGDSVNNFLALEMVDYGVNIMNRTGAIALLGAQTNVYDHLIFGDDLNDINSSTDAANICLTVDGFENRGYIVSSKIVSQNIEDKFQKIYVKYRPLNTGDKILVKYKDKDIMGIPVTTPQNILNCTWSDSNTLTTTADLSEVYTYLQTVGNECELEVLSGGGAGQMSQISSITYSAPTYTVNLVDDFTGSTASNTCDIIINNWKLLGTIDSTDMIGCKDYSIESFSKWIKFKIELRGVDTTLEEVQIINTTQIPSV